MIETSELRLEGIKIIRPKVFFDERGFFCQRYHAPFYREKGIDCTFVQDNHSFSKGGTIRGMHFQAFPGQAKLVFVLEGRIFDVVVDMRRSSPTFGKWEGVYLSAETQEQLFIPVGFAHGFAVLSEVAHVFYKVSSIYDPLQEKGFHYDDPDIGITWPISDPIVSSRDQTSPFFREVCG